ncbi:Lrp/AsnC family transcriptional regulator [Pyrococcus abyssi]|uniref:Uncharacterized HTH-type transcriptional regulator PYRAB00690 n=1 Tax=Pyrococcus abyssi (strain GE5 / Orsay) TaxID=272844 RepID=REG2_PYRAB|nr:Lrp/AsnC family transcriptional regulator [Pyrococcus abyssi]Q9V2K6.1 RecName: Full=Uncharacterized HTH-type transcriptional regulator PYRAB00690 [Pyrococcus abyssi GE5]CAB48992.1 Transcriptional regulator protein Lrp-Asn family [Pyrococcus abyssi GE5]CCE69441.1 TPA: transcriptional regulator [Pyrococcus abyssi GE5]
MRKLDKVDIQLVKILSQNSRLTYRELAELMNTTRQRIARRITKLKKLGVIKKFTIIPDLDKLGYMYAFVLVKLRVPSEVDAMISEISNVEYVKEIEKGVGRYNLIVRLLLPKDLKEAEGIINEFLQKIKNAESVEVVLISEIKKFEII